MKPFNDDPIGDRNRELYGDVVPRYERQKVAHKAWGDYQGTNGSTWKDIIFEPGPCELFSHEFDKAIYWYLLYLTGVWLGTPSIRMRIDGQKVYPFYPSETVTHANKVSLGCLSMSVRRGEAFTMQIYSSDAGETGTFQIYVGYVAFE